MNSNIIKGVSIGLGTIFVASNFYTISLLSKKSNLPMFDLPVSKYSTYEIEADMNSYRIRHKMHDPRIIASIENTRKSKGRIHRTAYWNVSSYRNRFIQFIG